MFSIGIIAAMVIFGGLVALLGDRVGMKVGKKRLSIFGLRPKHTSMIITVLTGFFIAGLTLVILMMMSEYVRTAIFHLHALEQDLKNNTTKVHQLTHEVIVKQQAIRLQENEYQDLTTKYRLLHQNLEDVTAQRQKVELRLAEAQTQFKQAIEELHQAQSNLSTTKTDLVVAQNRVNSLGKLTDDLNSKQEELKLENDRLTQNLQDVSGKIIHLTDEISNYNTNPLSFYYGQILLSNIVEPGMAEDKVFNEVVGPLLQKANQAALKGGARIPGKPDYALRVDPSQINLVCKKIADLKAKGVLRVVVEKNSVAGEPAVINLELLPNEIIFKGNEVIADMTVFGGSSETDLRDQLLTLLIRGYAKATQKGIYTNGAPSDMVSLSEMVKTINLIKQNKNSKVSLIAVNDIYRVDLFQARFDVSPIN